MTRREFLRRFGIASSALTFAPAFIDRMAAVCRASTPSTRVYMVKHGDCFQNATKLWSMLDSPSKYIDPSDIVVIKANGQWENQGYTHTGCIKGVIDEILAIPGFSGEVLICDNVQNKDDLLKTGFYAEPADRQHNWADHNWTTLASAYQAAGDSVAATQWLNGPDNGWTGPADGEGWVRSYFTFHGRDTYLSYPVFESPLTSGRMIDMKNGVWEDGVYTGQQVKTIFMPTLNNHGSGSEDYAGVTSAIKSFFGATEIHVGWNSTWNGLYHMHSSTFTQSCATCAGELTGMYINTMYAPMLYITAAMWSGHYSRTGDATETKTLLACDNPVTLDYVACRDVIAPYASWLNPDNNNHTRDQILGCMGQGIGTITPSEFEVMVYDFDSPTATRLDVERRIRDFKQGSASEQDVKDTINLYMDSE